MKSRVTIPLRVIIPGLTLIFGIVFGSVLILRERQISEQRLVKEMQRYATSRSSTIANMLQYLLRRNDLRGAELYVSIASSDINVQSVIVCNEKEEIIYSNRYDLRGRQLKEVADPHIFSLVGKARRSLSTQSSEAEQKHLYSVSSFLLPPASGELRPTGVGCVVLDLDLEMVRTARRNENYLGWAELAGLLFAFCGTIWLMLHITLGKRVRRLATAANQMGEGKLDIKIKVRGRDEITSLARSLETMAADIKVSRDKLKTAYNEMEGRVKLRTADLESARRKAYGLMQDANKQREKAEEALAQLRESQRELRILSRAIEQSPAEVMITDAEGCITYVNPAFSTISGYSAEEVIGLQSNFLSACVQPDKVYDDLWESITAGNSWCGEFCNQTKSGEIYWEMASISPVRDEDEKITHFVSVKEDVTEQKRVAEELAAAKQAAESANEAKSAFLANMSHEIRTPMNIIIGMSHLALDTEMTNKQHDYVQKISGAANSLLGIINDILDFSKIEAGKMTVEEEPFKLDDVISNVTGLMGLRLEQKELELLIDIERTTPLQLRGDSLRVAQILNNLLSNAIKFTDKGEIKLSVQLAEKTADRVELDFCIRDSGIGMTAEQLEKLFKSFTQADSSTTRKYGGTGLGLAICKQLCELLGGWIRAESEPGKGSSFHFHLPFGNVDGQIARTEFKRVNNLKGMRILVVDDKRAVRELIKKFLDAMGFLADTAASGKEALQHIEEKTQSGQEYGLVILDWSMPEMDGIETGRRIRALNLKTEPKLLMLTAYGHDEVMFMAEESGFSGFLLKPVHASQLFNTILRLFGKTSSINKADRHQLKAHAAGARILLVEDHEINQQVAVELLEKMEMNVTVASNGQEAIDLISSHEFDLVLMDIQMPVMDGLTATRAIRTLNQQLPILAMTAHAMTGDKAESLAAGMNGHITKPIDPDKVVQALNEWLPDHAREPGPAQIDQPKEPLPHINGLDTDKAIRRLGGNLALYHRLLEQFTEHQNAGSLIRSALAQQDLKEAARIAHMIKGVAGNLGAEQLQLQAAELESLLRANNPAVEGPLQQFTTILQQTIDAINAFQPETTERTQPAFPPGDLDELPRQLDQLQIHLTNRTPKPCKEIMHGLINQKWPPEISIDIKSLHSLVGRYRFNEAKEAVEKTMSTVNKSKCITGEPHEY
jgi:PAS domain S-box-containing protein